MAKRIFLHVGTPKTGTTYLQSVLWANKATLGEQGLLLPLERVRDHFFLSCIARGTQQDLADLPPRGLTSWQRMLDEVGNWDGDALISHELFAMALPPRAEWTIDQLRSVADEVHPIITARDLARQLPAEWQQSVKHGRTYRIGEFYDLVKADDPSITFWRSQKLPFQLEIWGQGLPPENLHLVTVPPPAAPRGELWARFSALVGIDPGSVDLSVTVPNESLGVVEIETMRRVNAFAPRGSNGKPLRAWMVRQVLAEGILADRTDAVPFAPPPEAHPWVIEHGTAIVEELRGMACDVVGDLDDLLPPLTPKAGPTPDDVDDTAVAAVAVETISAVLYRSHDRELAQQTAEIERLKRTVADKNTRVSALQRRVSEAQQAAAHHQHRPIWRRVAGRARVAAGKVRSRLPG